MVKKGEDPEMNPQTKKGGHAKPAGADANQKRMDAIKRNVTGQTGTPQKEK